MDQSFAPGPPKFRFVFARPDNPNFAKFSPRDLLRAAKTKAENFGYALILWSPMDDRRQDDEDDGRKRSPTARGLGLPMARAREPLPAGRNTRFWASATVTAIG